MGLSFSKFFCGGCGTDSGVYDPRSEKLQSDTSLHPQHGVNIDNGMARRNSPANQVFGNADIVSLIAQFQLVPSHLTVGSAFRFGDAEALHRVNQSCREGVKQARDIQLVTTNQNSHPLESLPPAVMAKILACIAGGRRHTFNDWGRPGLQSIAPLSSTSRHCNNAVKAALSQRFQVERPYHWRQNGLMWAIQRGDLRLLRELLASGRLGVDGPDEWGNSPLHYASVLNKPDAVGLLCDNRANVNTHDATGRTSLHFASLIGNLETCLLLIQHKAAINARDNAGKTPLHLACEQGRVHLSGLLMENGADVNAQDNNGWTPLHEAMNDGYLDLCSLLLQRGADVNSEDADGTTPLFLASQPGRLDLGHLLLEHKADVNVRDINGWTPLHAAAGDGHLDFCGLLITHQANVNARLPDGRTPIQLVRPQGHPDLVTLFRKHGAI